jgi:hypothetical protein
MAEDSGIKRYQYPSNIDKDEFKNRRVLFMALTGTGLNNTSKQNMEKIEESNKGNLLASITLPLTSNISDSQDHSWQSTDYYSVLTGAVKAGTNAGGSEQGKTGLEVLDTVRNALEGPTTAAIADILGKRRPMLNPGYFQYYTGSNLRSFDFSFDFIPENEKETQSVIDIITAFKMYSSPSRPLVDARNEYKPNEKGDFSFGSWLMFSPCQWIVVVYNEKIWKLLSFHRCVCTRVSVTYGDSDKVAMFNDGMPKQVSLSLSFSETELQFADSYGSTPNYMKDVGLDVLKTIDDVKNYVSEFVSESKTAFGLMADDLAREAKSWLPWLFGDDSK